MKLGEAKTKAIKYINEYSNNGNLISTTTNADYLLRMNDLANAAQMEIATVRKIQASFSISQNPIINQLGLLQGFDEIQHLGSDNTTTVAVGSKSYYFEVDRQCTVYIEEQINNVWTILSTITVPSTVTTFASYKGLITPSSALNNVRIRFSGAYPYNIRNRALYAYTFPTANDVPDYRPFVKYDMPADFMELKKVTQETDPRQYTSLKDYRWEGIRTFVVNYYQTGSFRIEYYKYPTVIDSTTDDNTSFEVDLVAQEAIPYYIGAHVMIGENPGISTLLLNLYQSKLGNMSNIDSTNMPLTKNAMGW